MEIPFTESHVPKFKLSSMPSILYLSRKFISLKLNAKVSLRFAHLSIFKLAAAGRKEIILNRFRFTIFPLQRTEEAQAVRTETIQFG